MFNKSYRVSLIWVGLLILVSALTTSSRPPTTVSLPLDGGWSRLPFQSASGFSAVEVSSGPLLVYQTGQQLKLLDPERALATHRLTDCGDYGGVIDRLDRDHLLLDLRGLVILQLSTGKALRLPGKRFVSLDRDQFYFFESYPWSGRLGVCSGQGWKWLSPHGFDRVIGETAQGLLAVGGRELYLVSNHGGVRSLCRRPDFPGGKVCADVSPDGLRLAVGCPSGTLLILDLASGREIIRKTQIPLMHSGSSLFPSLECAWVDARTVRYSMSEIAPLGLCYRWVDFDVESGTATIGPRQSTMGASHPSPVPQLAAPQGIFEIRDYCRLHCRLTGHTFVQGSPTWPQWNYAAIEHGGGWAAGNDPARDGRLVVCDRAGHERALPDRPVAVTWLPRVGPMPAVRDTRSCDYRHQPGHRFGYERTGPNVAP